MLIKMNPSKFFNETRVVERTATQQGCAATQRDFGRLEKWNLKQFKKLY